MIGNYHQYLYNTRFMKINNNNIRSPKTIKPLHTSNTNKNVIPQVAEKVYTNQNNKKKGKSHTHSNSHNKSHSNSKKFNSFIFQNARNSLCCGSPRHVQFQQKDAAFNKYKTYIEFIDAGKVTPSVAMSKRNSFVFQKRKSMTPTPKRNSLPNTERYQRQRRKNSVFQNYHNNQNKPKSKKAKQLKQVKQISKERNSQPLRPSNSKNTNLCVKGKVIKHESKKKGFNLNLNIKIKDTKGKDKLKKKKQQDSTQNNETIRTNMSSQQKLNIQEERVLNKLFKGIQFHRDLGKGAHALVKSAVDWNHKRKIAIKIYQKLNLNQQEIKSIEKEVEILMSLAHPNIIKLYQIIESYKTINLIMEYGGGNSLEQFIKNKTEGRLSEEESAKIFIQVLKAVAYLDKMNIVHRDLKTENILLNKHLELKIIDFGFSLICPSQGKISSYCGTPTYMAPQVVTKTPHNPHLADRWSLGILLYSMLNGCCPFKGANQKQLFQKIQAGQYWFLSNISDEAKSLIQKFLVKDPKKRISPQQALQSSWVLKFKATIQQKQKVYHQNQKSTQNYNN